MTADDFLTPFSKRPLVVPCDSCPAYADPMKCVEVSTRTATGWDVKWLCPVCAERKSKA